MCEELERINPGAYTSSQLKVTDKEERNPKHDGGVS